MARFDYSKLDAEILEKIKEEDGIDFTSLVFKTHEEIPKGNVGGRFRAVDRRLQSLRKKMKIHHSEGGWHILNLK